LSVKPLNADDYPADPLQNVSLPNYEKQ